MTDGERLYACLLQVRPTQFSEVPKLLSEPRPKWSELSDREQWTREDWERIAEKFLARADRTGEALYDCVLEVSPQQRRRAGHVVKRQPWAQMNGVLCGDTPHGRLQWNAVARLFADHMGAQR